MLVKNIVAFSLLAFQAGFGIAKPLAGYVSPYHFFDREALGQIRAYLIS
jgi:hypothetical protein